MSDADKATPRLRIAYFGSGAFGLPTLKQLVALQDVVLVVTQPDRPAGRRRVLTPTPVGEYAAQQGLRVIKPENPNDAEMVSEIRTCAADAFVVIAYGHKLSPQLLGDTFAINLHASLLPRYRGAAPINWAMINNEFETGVSVIHLAQRMDAGEVLAQRATRIDPLETAGELHDRLAVLGVEPVMQTLTAWRLGTLKPIEQDETVASQARKLTKADGTVDFNQPAADVRARIHGLNPWPGCTVVLDGTAVKLLRVQDTNEPPGADPGTLLAGGCIACSPGLIRVLEIQPVGSRIMSWAEFDRGRRVATGARCTQP